jgi:hypothetical protein
MPVDLRRRKFHIATMRIIIIVAATLLLLSCARTTRATEDVRGESAPCADCRSDEAVALKFLESHAYREWGVDILHMDSGAVVGVLPVLRLSASGPEDCKICHSFSVDAVDFDFSATQDSLLRAAFPHQNWELLYPGLQVPERDTIFFAHWLDSLAQSTFAHNQPLQATAFWRERTGEQRYTRPVPPALRGLLGRLGGRYAVRYLVIPVVLHVELQPDSGKRGGYQWESLWTLWDARQGTLLVLDYQAFTAATTGTAPPDRLWSAAWAQNLGAALQRGPRSDEAH